MKTPVIPLCEPRVRCPLRAALKTRFVAVGRWPAAIGIFAAAVLAASGQVTSSLVLTDSSAGAGASIDGMELRGTGLYWWKYGYAGGEIGSYVPSLGIKSAVSRYALNLDRAGPFYMVQGGSYPAGAERDGAYAYFTANRGGAQCGLFRQLLSSAVNSAPERLAGIVTPDISTGAIGRFGRDLFFAPTYAGGYTAIWRVSFDEAGNYTGAGVTAEGFLNGYAVRKILFLNATINGNTGTYGVCLQADSSLWRFGPLESGSLQPIAYLGAGVGDIGIRRDDGGHPFNGLHDKIYATTSPVTGGPIGKLVTISPANGVVTEIYADPGGQKFLAFGSDSNFLFISRANAPSGEILRKFVPYLSYITNPVPGQPAGWVTIETVSGTNLRSDGRLLYFTRGNQIRRLGTAVPGITVDVQAFGIEAVQISQDYNNSWPLVEGKPVLVRGYARMAALANAGGTTRQPAATLAVTRNDVSIGNFHPENAPQLDAEPATSLAIYRGAIGRSFNFVIPAEQVQRGTMRFTLTVNDPRSMIETGVANPYNNNTVSTPVMQVLAAGAPTIVCVPLDTTDGTYTLDTNPGDFWAQIARARSLLPVSDIRVQTSATVLQRWVVQYDPPKSGFTRFRIPGDESEALSRLGAVRGEVSGHNVGMVPPAVSGFNGLGNITGAKNLLVRMEPAAAVSPGSGWDSSRGGRTLAHEMTHNYGRLHVNFTSGSETPRNPDMGYLGNPANISGVAGAGNNNLATSVFGWDPLSGQCIDGAAIPDLMSYGDSRWLSRYTFDALLAAIPAAAAGARSPQRERAPAVEGDVFLISGMVELAEARASLEPVQVVPDGTYNADLVAESIAAATLPPGHDYLVRQLDEADAVLAESPLVLSPTGDGWLAKTGFRQFLAASPGAIKLQIVKGGGVLAQVDGQGATPAVFVDAPLLDAGGQVLTWSWTAVDPDGDPVFSTVHFSADGGLSWKAVEQQSINSSLAVDVRTLPGGANCQLRIIVTDGFNTAIAASDAFALPTHAPEITLIGVKPGQKLDFGASAALTAFAMDAEEGSLPGNGISWVLDGPQPAVKAGDTLYLDGLPPGNYVATASVVDAEGTPASKELAFEVLPIPLTVTAAPGLNGEIDDAAYATATLVRWSSGNNGRVSARLLRSGGRLYVGFSELPYRVAGNPLARVGIRIDVDGSADAAVQSSDFGFFLDEDGRPLQTEGDGVTMVTGASPAGGFEAALNSGETSWTAEFALPEAVLGGAEHGMRIMFTVELGQSGGESLLYRWPEVADINSPATWAPVQLGELPTPANAPPIAHAGGNQVVAPTEDLTIFLNGSGSVDPEDQPLTYRWRQTDGEPVALVDDTSAICTFVISPVASTNIRRFELIVNDGELDSAPVEITVTAMAVVPPWPAREVSRFTRYADGSIEGFFSPDDFLEAGGIAGQGSLGSQGLYSIETSENLVDWTPQFDASPDLLGRLIFNDLAAADYPTRFYRAVNQAAAGMLSPGSALEFDGSVRWVNVPHTTAFNTYPLTVSAWIQTTDTASLVGGIVSKYADASVNGWGMFTYAGRVRGFYFAGGSREVWGGGLGIDGGFIADGAWHHVAMVIGATGGTIYVDGAATGSLPWTGTPAATSTTQPVQIGRYSYYPNGFAGQIDEVSIWAAELTSLQILDLRRRGPVGTETDLRALWKLDDAEGTLATDSGPDLRHGVLNGSPQWVPSTAPIRR